MANHPCAPSWCWMRWKWRSPAPGRTASSSHSTKASQSDTVREHSATLQGSRVRPAMDRRRRLHKAMCESFFATFESRCWNVALLLRQGRARSSGFTFIELVQPGATHSCGPRLPLGPWPTNRRWRIQPTEAYQPSSPALPRNGGNFQPLDWRLVGRSRRSCFANWAWYRCSLSSRRTTVLWTPTHRGRQAQTQRMLERWGSLPCGPQCLASWRPYFSYGHSAVNFPMIEGM